MEKKAQLQKNVKLLPHQEEAVNKFLQAGGNQIFAHGVGSGKSITSIGAVERSGAKKALILTPASLQKNYIDSIHKFVEPEGQKKYKVMSYQKFRMAPEKFIKEEKPDIMVVDEFQNQRNPKSLSFKSLQNVRRQVPKFIGLSGTIANNSPNDVFPLTYLASSGKVPFKSQQDFEKRFVASRKEYPKGIIKNIFARLTGRFGEKKVLKNTEQIRKQIHPFVHKNIPTKEFLSKFPKKEFVNIDVPMTREQEKRYKYFEKKELGPIDRWLIHNDLPPKLKDRQKFFSRLSTMRQISDSPTIASTGKIKDPFTSSGKMQAAFGNLKKHLSSDPRHKALVYSNFTRSGLGSMEDILKKNKIPYAVFSGDIKRKQRNQNLTDYNAGKIRTLLVSPSGAEGLDTKGTTLLQNLEPHWNPSKMDQIYGRAARYKSHENLPEPMKKVRIEKYRSTLKPSFIDRLKGKKFKPSVDHYIYHRAEEKEELNRQLNELL